MALRWPDSKDPSETDIYTVNWLDRLGGETISTSSFAVALGTVTITGQSHTTTAANVTLSGGVDGEQAQITNTIVTSGARTLEETIILWILDSSLRNLTSYTKGDLVLMALGELGIANYEFDIEAEEDIRALNKLDGMMAEMTYGLTETGYIYPAASGSSAIADPPGIDASIVEAVVANLAVKLAPGYGKTPSSETRKAAREGKNLILAKYVVTTPMVFSSASPMGAGNRRLFRNYFPAADAEA
jgi:hypothetical protein